MTTITPITGNLTTTSFLSTSDVLYLISAVYSTGSSVAVDILAGTNVDIVFRDGGSVLNTFSPGIGILASTDIHLTIEDGSSLSCGSVAVNMQGHVLTLTNFGSLVGTGTTAIALAGDGSSVTNYGEIRGATGYTSSHSATIDNFGTISANSPSNAALDLGSLNDSVDNHGTLFGETLLGAGTDSIFNSGTMRGDTAIIGSAGNKTIVNSGLIAAVPAADAISLGSGNDTITNLGHIIGSVHLGDGFNTFDDRGGGIVTGTVVGGSTSDNLYGGAGIDNFDGGAGNDALIGGGGDDSLDGGEGNDVMIGGIGGDSFHVDSPLDSVVEGKGEGVDDVFAKANFALQVGVEVEFLIADTTSGLALTGNEFAQTIAGSSGNDTLDGGGGADTLRGRNGNDTYVLGAEATGVDTVTDSGGTDTITSAISRSLASFSGIENLRLTGTAAINGTGNGLANAIVGNSAANVINGGAGLDHLTGGAGKDFFVFNAPLSAANRDVVIDFSHVDDTFRLENAVMKALGTHTGALNPAFFFAGAAAHDADDHIIYNQNTGNLFYDSNGNHAGGLTLLATLAKPPALLANDFVVI